MTTHTRQLATLTASILTLGLTACTSDSDETANSTATPATAAQGNTATASIPGSDPDPRCQPFDVALLSGILNDTTLTPTNGQVITDGADKWIGATLLRADGEMESRSDVWLMNASGLFAVTGGARNNTWAAPATKVGYSAGDEHSQAVDGCVIALTRRGASTSTPVTVPDPTLASTAAPEAVATPEVVAPDNGFESGGIVDGPVVPDPDIPGANQPLPGEPGYTGPLTAEEFDNMSNAERSNHGFSAATPANCDGFQGAHEDSEALNC